MDSNSKDLAYFPADYDQARARFCEQSRRICDARPSARALSFFVPSSIDPDLSVDALHIPASGAKSTLLVLISGVHGAEAATGSAIQEMFVHELLPGITSPGVGVLLVHAMNPFGFKYGRRATENNVNLNRNYSLSARIEATPNEGYTRARPLLEPSGRAGRAGLAFSRTFFELGRTLLTRGFDIPSLNQAVGQGQFHWPQGLEYGGERPEPQVGFFLDLLRESARGYKELLILDLHTGLGDRYQLHLIPGDLAESFDEALFRTYFDLSVCGGTYALTTGESDGFYKTIGDLNSLVPRFLEPGQKGLALTLEFGTLGNGTIAKLQTLHRLVEENRGWHHGYVNREAKRRVKREFAELFFPSEPAWRRNAIERSRSILRELVSRMSG